MNKSIITLLGFTLISFQKSFAVDSNLKLNLNEKLELQWQKYQLARETLLQKSQQENLPLEQRNITREEWESLIALSPNQEESDKLKSFNGDIKLISSSERFCMMLITIPKFLNKLEMIKYKLILDPEIFECRRKYDFLIEAAIIIRVIYS